MDNLRVALSAEALRQHTRDDLGRVLRNALRNVNISIEGDPPAVSVLGPTTEHFNLDPDLAVEARGLGAPPDANGILRFRTRTQHFDLCFEDSWTGYFVSDHLQAQARRDVVLIHLDDHPDMMPALFYEDGGVIRALSTGREFSVHQLSNWEDSILSGAVGLGNYLTPFFFDLPSLHVAHLYPRSSRVLKRYSIRPEYKGLGELEGVSGIQHAIPLSLPSTTVAASKSVSVSSDASVLFSALPDGLVIGHIDLDYFINDFDGRRSGDEVKSVGADAYEVARERARDVADAIARSGRSVERWIIGTSPGFCAAKHWPRLLEIVETEIVRRTETA